MAEQLGVDAVFANHDYGPQAGRRDARVARLSRAAGRVWFGFKDLVIYERDEAPLQSGKP